MDDREFRKQFEIVMARMQPEWHRPVNLSIKDFKRYVKTLPLKKSTKNYMIKRYKNRAWAEFWGLPGPKGTFPTVPRKGIRIDVKSLSGFEYDIEVKVSGK